MSSIPSPSPSSAASETPVHAVVHGIWLGLSNAISHSPWIAPLFALVVVSTVVRFVRGLIHTGARDPVRRFPRATKRLLLDRAGGRCERHGWLTGRCRETERLEADHVHPWSRGGWTHPANGQILCQRHNRMKRAAIPWDRQLRKLAERRSGYFPPGVDTGIVRVRPRALPADSGQTGVTPARNVLG